MLFIWGDAGLKPELKPLAGGPGPAFFARPNIAIQMGFVSLAEVFFGFSRGVCRFFSGVHGFYARNDASECSQIVLWRR